MAIVPESSLTVVVRAWILMLIFCFAGCAAGSCLSYGHSCWGAHGKRSGGYANTNMHLVSTKTMTDDFQEDTPSYAKEQWILSRLIAGRPLVPIPNKYRPRWNNLSKVKLFAPQRWNYDDTNTHTINENLLRNRNVKDDIEVDTARKVSDMDDIAQNIIEERDEVPEILLISRNEQNERHSKPQSLDLLKILNKENDNFE